MQRKNLFFGASAVLVAVGAVGAGVMVSSNAMAASGSLGDHALTISMVSVGTNGDAFQCTFDAAAVPGVPIAVAPGSEGGTDVVTVEAGGGLPTGATVISGDAVFGAGSHVSLPPGLPPLPGGGTGGAIAITGSVNADGSSSVSQIGADGTVTPVKVRQGTAAECAAAQKGVPPVGPGGVGGGAGGAGGATLPTLAVDPKG
jgi:hypothetical protein